MGSFNHNRKNADAYRDWRGGEGMRILAIDPGSKTGFASNCFGFLESGVVEFAIKRGESQGMRFIRFNAWLVEMLTVLKPRLVVYEMAHLRGGAPTNLLVGMTTRIEEQCAQKEIQYTSVHSGTLKKWATGKGNCGKKEMIEAAKKWKEDITSDDEADALILLKWAESEFRT
jgi:Holliday junction resolvasome RuvABC endonuclease subunit